jgi:ribosomal protein L34E
MMPGTTADVVHAARVDTTMSHCALQLVPLFGVNLIRNATFKANFSVVLAYEKRNKGPGRCALLLL